MNNITACDHGKPPTFTVIWSTACEYGLAIKVKVEGLGLKT